MSKRKVVRKKTKEEKELIPSKYQNLVFSALIAILVFVFFAEAIQSDGGFGASDNIASQSFETYKKECEEKGEFPLWIPHVFSGMPSYQSLMLTGDRYWDIPPQIVFGFAEIIKEVFGSDVARLAFYYILYGIGLYFLLNYKGMNKYISFLCSFSAVFSTSIIVWVVIGHNTKPVVMAMLPFTLLAYEKLRHKFSFIWLALLVIILHIMLEGSHLQMIFYSAFIVGLYILIDLIGEISKKSNLKGVLSAVLFMAIASGLSFAMSADRYLSTLEYTPHSTRGSAPTLEKEGATAKTEDGGNTYAYATQYSFSPGEMMTFFVPAYYGYGSLNYKSDNQSSILNQLTQNGERPLYTYWGQKEIEDAPPYMGIIILAFAIFGAIVNFRDRFVKFLSISGLFFLLLSFGDNFNILYDLFFYNFPNFNKFRAPSMALAMLQFVMPILAGYGLFAVFKMKKGERDTKPLQIFLYFAAGFLLIGLIFAAAMKGFYFNQVNFQRFFSNNLGSVADRIDQNMFDMIQREYKEFMFKTAYMDWITNGFILLIAVFISKLFVQDRLSKNLLLIVLFALSIFDLWRMAYRKYDPVDQKIEQNYFRKPDYIDFVQKDNDIFRISDGIRGTNFPAYFLVENVGGYHAAKLRIYQDMLDATSQGSTSRMTNPFMWSLLNVKYIVENRQLPGFEVVFESQQGSKVMKNPAYLPRAFFVDSAAQMSNIEVLRKLKNNEMWNPLQLAYLEKMPKEKIDKPDSTASVKIIEKGFHNIELEAKASGNNLLFLSEIYYEPGWRATIDGEETEIHRANFGFRALLIPKGKHKIKLKYNSPAFEQGKTLSTASNIILGILLLIGVFFQIKNSKKNDSRSNK